MLSVWNKCSDIGIQDGQPRIQQTEIRLLNQVVIILLVVLGIRGLMDFCDGDFVGLSVLSTMFFLYSISLLFQHFQKLFFAKSYFVFIFILTGTLVTMLMGRDLGGEFVFFTASILTLVFFYNTRSSFVLFALILLGYTLAQWFQHNYDEPLADSVTPLSYHFMAFANIFCSILIATNFIKQNQIFSRESLLLLDDLEGKNQKLESSQIQIQDQNNKLEVVNMELERFAFVASHDLKTPLRSISSFVQLIDRKLIDLNIKDEKISEYLGFVVQSTKHMHRLIEGVLEYSRISKGELEFEEVDLNELIKVIKINLQQFLKESNATIEISELPIITGNLSSLTLMMQNLIENGIKYNQSSNPTIRITSLENEKEYVISVSDNGIGIDPEYFDKVFEMFARLHNQDTYTGSGIGLAFCQKIVESHGGNIRIKSSDENGSVFTICLPKQFQTIDLGYKMEA